MQNLDYKSDFKAGDKVQRKINGQIVVGDMVKDMPRSSCPYKDMAIVRENNA